MDLTEDQIQRYSRHILLKEIGVEGQTKLLGSSVLIAGAGGLGSPVAFYLAAAGVGRIGLADGDIVDISNLQRQIIHSSKEIGKLKVASAAEKIRALNPDVQVDLFPEKLTYLNIAEVIKTYDIVVDGTDNFAAKFLINDACVLGEKTLSHGGILRFHGQTMTIQPGQSACYRCVFRTPPPRGSVPTCSEAGVLGAVAGMLGTIQAAEVLKVLSGMGASLLNTLLSFDALTMDFRKVKLRKDPSCPVCGEKPSILELQDESSGVCEVYAPADPEKGS